MDTREHIHDPGKDSDFLARRERALVLKEKKNYSRDFIKINNVTLSRNIIREIKRKSTEWNRRLAIHTLDRWLVFRITSCKVLLQINDKGKNSKKKNEQKTWNLILKDKLKASKNMKRFPTSLIIREIKTKTTRRHHFIYPVCLKWTIQHCGQARVWSKWNSHALSVGD